MSSIFFASSELFTAKFETVVMERGRQICFCEFNICKGVFCTLSSLEVILIEYEVSELNVQPALRQVKK